MDETDSTATPFLTTVRSALGDRYDDVREIGRGATSTVYAGYDRKLERDVAIKVLRPELSATIAADRFRQEVGFLSSLNHPNILKILDSSAVGSVLFLTTPYAGGDTLRARLERAAPLSTELAYSVARQIASALDHAHSRNVIHRDIKPENIVFDQNGNVLVCDFGVSRAVVRSGGEALSSIGLQLGTPQYMSPEQCRGDSTLTGATDIYALACVTYETLVGEPPFTARALQTILTRHLHDQPPKLSVVRPDVPAPVGRAIEWALQKDPAKRPRTAAEFVAEFPSGA